MEFIEKLKRIYDKDPHLIHASNLCSRYRKGEHLDELAEIMEAYSKYIKEMRRIKTTSNAAVRKRVRCLNEYYNFIHEKGWDTLYIQQTKFRSTIMEEFLYLLFKNDVERFKDKYGSQNLLSGSAKAYTNLFFTPKNFENFITRSDEIGINEKDQDYAIYRMFSLTVDGSHSENIQVPAVAIETKRYIDKTMLDSIIATAEKLKSGNPYTLFVAVAESYNVDDTIDPFYSRIDQIYVLRKMKREDEWKNIDVDVVLRLHNDIIDYLNRPWSDVAKRLTEEGVIFMKTK